MKFLICLALSVAVAQASVIGPVTYSAPALPAFATYAAPAPIRAYAAPAYTASVYGAPAFSPYSALAAPSIYGALPLAYGARPLAYGAPAVIPTLLKK